MSMTRRDLRRKIAGDMRDLVVFTAHEGSSNNMVVNPVELADFDNTLVSSQLLCCSGANKGHVARVTGSSQIGSSVSFNPPTPEPVSPGDEFELVNLRGTGFRFEEYHRQIASLVTGLAAKHPRRLTSDPITYNAEFPSLIVPEGWIAVYGASLLEVDGSEFPFKRARSEGARGWHVDAATRTFTLGGTDLSRAHGQEIVLHGLIAHPEVADDDDLIHIDPEWLSLTIASRLAQRRGDREWNQWAIEWARMAGGERPARLFRYPANTVMLEAE
jgi:hypothetical protein